MIIILRSPEVLQACCVAVSAQADAPIPISSSGISGTNGTIFGDVQGLPGPETEICNSTTQQPAFATYF